MKSIQLLFCLSIFFLFSCNDTTELQNQLTELQNQLEATEAKLATPPSDPTAFVHTVFFWMNEEVSDDQLRTFQEGLKSLTTISTVKKAYLGKTAPSDRDVVDTSYDYALILHFADQAGQDAYQIDPIHLAFVEASKGTWEKVQVYDTLVDK